MKTFIYSVTEKRARYYRKLTFTVFRLIRNTPVFIGICTANTGSYRGEDSTVMNYLIEKKQIPAKNYGYYHNSKGNFKLHII